jgi:hypothetical protein
MFAGWLMNTCVRCEGNIGPLGAANCAGVAPPGPLFGGMKAFTTPEPDIGPCMPEVRITFGPAMPPGNAGMPGGEYNPPGGTGMFGMLEPGGPDIGIPPGWCCTIFIGTLRCIMSIAA